MTLNSQFINLNKKIITCKKCKRLKNFREKIAKQKRKQYKDAIEEYVLSLFSNPRNHSSISRRILIMGDDIDSKNVIENKYLQPKKSMYVGIGDLNKTK